VGFLDFTLPLLKQTIRLPRILPRPLQTALRSLQLTLQLIIVLLQKHHIRFQRRYHVLLHAHGLFAPRGARRLVQGLVVFGSVRCHSFRVNRPMLLTASGLSTRHVTSIIVFLVLTSSSGLLPLRLLPLLPLQLF